jgi:hypothetical protein
MLPKNPRVAAFHDGVIGARAAMDLRLLTYLTRKRAGPMLSPTGGGRTAKPEVVPNLMPVGSHIVTALEPPNS